MWLDALREMKLQSGLTTREISTGSGIPEPTLEKIFSGATKEPKLPTMIQLVHFLGYTLDDLDSLGTKKGLANHTVDEARERIITQLCQMSPEEFELVDAFVQGMKAKHRGE